MSEPNEIAATPRPPAIYWVLALTLAAVLLYFSLRGIAWLRVWTILRGARLPIVALVIAIISFNLLMRSLRWRVILAADRRVPFHSLLGHGGRVFGQQRAAGASGRTGAHADDLRAHGHEQSLRADHRFLRAGGRCAVPAGISGTILLTLPVTPGWLARAAGPSARSAWRASRRLF